MSDYYEILGVSPNATETEIKTKYRTLAKTKHPDKGGNSEEFSKINEAYEILRDKEKRERYDSLRKNFSSEAGNAPQKAKAEPTTEVPKAKPQPKPETKQEKPAPKQSAAPKPEAKSAPAPKAQPKPTESWFSRNPGTESSSYQEEYSSPRRSQTFKTPDWFNGSEQHKFFKPFPTRVRIFEKNNMPKRNTFKDDFFMFSTEFKLAMLNELLKKAMSQEERDSKTQYSAKYSKDHEHPHIYVQTPDTNAMANLFARAFLLQTVIQLQFMGFHINSAKKAEEAAQEDAGVSFSRGR